MSADPRRRPDGNAGAWLIGVGIVLASAMAFLFLRDGRRVEPVRPVADGEAGPLSYDECQRIAALWNLGVAHLENGDHAPAIDIFERLSKESPDAESALRNLAVARILALKEGDDGALDGVLARLPGDSGVSHVLRARTALARREQALARGEGEAAQEQEAIAVRELEDAARLLPNDPANWLELSEVAAAAEEGALREKKSPALERAYSLTPDNLALTTRRLIDQAERRDPGIANTIAAARELVRPLVEPVRQRNAGVNLDDFLNQSVVAVDQGQWNQVAARLGRFRNVLMPEEWWKSDNHRVHERHLLAFMAQSSGVRCGETADPAIEASSQRPDLAFVRKEGIDALPTVDGAAVRALRVVDVDLDGMFDVVVLERAKLSIFGRGDFTRPWGQLATSPVPEGAVGMLAADLDREGAQAESGTVAARRQPGEARQSDLGTCQEADVDFVIFGSAGAVVYRNEPDAEAGKRKLVRVEQEPEFDALRDVLAGVLVDFDHDGDLDIVFSSEEGMSMWLNRGDMRFYQATNRSKLPPSDLKATSLVAVDWDLDLDLDVLAVGLGNGPAGVLENLRHGQLRWKEFDIPWVELTGSRALCLREATYGGWDLIGGGNVGIRQVTHGGQLSPTPAGSERIRSMSDYSAQIADTPVTGLLSLDFDNDGFMDLVAWDGSALSVFRGLGGDKFQALAGLFDRQPNGANVCAVGDLDGDGDQDLVVAERNAVTIYDNDGGNRNHRLDVRIRGEEDNKSGSVNHLGIGSVIEVKAGPFYRRKIVTDQVTHFGLGQRDRADVVRIIWTNGVPQVLIHPKADQSMCEVHKPDTSCPFLYAWNGERFEFVTDLLWNAPLGLQLAEGVLARPRAWEYLKIDGDRLRPKGGRYVLQFTGELWEADYFDHVELIAVDHPADIAVYSNEKVGPAEIAEFKVHTVRRPRAPVAARNARGEDVLEIVNRADGNYLKGHTFNYCKGLTDEHFLELDLGDLRSAKQVTLFLTGWLYPSNTSNRVAVSQDPNLPLPKPPALSVPDANGAWREVRPFMGFPGGKTKTIAVDLTDAFLTDDYRVRITTNWEFYWDHAFFAVDEAAAPFELKTLPVAGADLHYRGFSTLVPNAGWGPEHYDYARVGFDPRWAPMRGFFTRYGDVTELLTRQDDLQVILGSGDEMTVSFDVPAEDPPDGWKRDFILHNVGWDKDAVLNTVYGQTVEPLPFHGMSGYPYGPEEAFPQTDRHQEYLHKYQTRTQSSAKFWRYIRDFDFRARASNR